MLSIVRSGPLSTRETSLKRYPFRWYITSSLYEQVPTYFPFHFRQDLQNENVEFVESVESVESKGNILKTLPVSLVYYIFPI